MLTVTSFAFGPITENTYVLYNENRDCLIIDPGCYFGNERRELAEHILSNGLRPKYLLNTHCHFDHVFGNKFIHDEYGLEVYLHPDEQSMLQNAARTGLAWGFPFDNYTGPVHLLRENDTISLG